MRTLAALALLLVATHAVAQDTASPKTLSGSAVALDGDTLLLSPAGGDETVTVRLFGIDAPEMRDLPLGWRARAALDDLIGDSPTTCILLGDDDRGRLVGLCHSSDAGPAGDFGRALIANGWAVEYRRFTRRNLPPATPADLAARYAAAERTARRGYLGIWASFRP